MAISVQSVQPSTGITNVNPVRGIRSQIKRDVQALSTAVQSGDLATAQESYGDLQKLLQGNGSIRQATTTRSAPLDTIRSDFQTLGKDLQAGDLAAAKKDYDQLATDSQKIVSQQQDGGQAGGGSAENLSTTNASAASTTARSSSYSFQFTASLQGFHSSSASLDPLQSDFQTIGKDLEAGNLHGVQKDYAQLVTDSQRLFSPSAYQYSLTASNENASTTQSGTSQALGYDFGSFQAHVEGGAVTTDSPNVQFPDFGASRSQAISYLG